MGELEEFSTILTSRKFPPLTSISSVACQEGDRLVIEIGYRQLSGFLSYTAGISIGAGGTTITTATACTATLAGLGAGNLSQGQYRYKVTFYNNYGETDAVAVSNTVEVTDPATNGQMALSAIPVGGAGTTGRKIYRTQADGLTFKLLATIANNIDITYADNIADGGLGTDAPAFNTTGDLPENEYETGSYNGWFEFSDDILFSEVSTIAPVEVIGTALFKYYAPAGFVTDADLEYVHVEGSAVLVYSTPDGAAEFVPDAIEVGGEALFRYTTESIIETPTILPVEVVGSALLLYQTESDIDTPSIPLVPVEVTGSAVFKYMAPSGLLVVIPGVDEDLPVEITGSAIFLYSTGAGVNAYPSPIILPLLVEGSAILYYQTPTDCAYPYEPDLFPVSVIGSALFNYFSESAILLPGQSYCLIEGSAVFVYETPEGNVYAGTSYQENSETWVLNGQGWQPSMYSGWDFNSFIEIDGKYYGCKDDGIYLLEGETDDGTAFHTGLRLVTNFGANNLKRLRAVYAENCGDDTRLKVMPEEGSDIYYLDRERFTISKVQEGREFTLEFADFEEMGHLEMVPFVKGKR